MVRANGSSGDLTLEQPDLSLVDRPRLAPAVVPTVRTHAVRRLGLVTVRAFAEADSLQCVVRPAFGRPRLRVSSFWIWHRLSQAESLLPRGGGSSFSASCCQRSAVSFFSEANLGSSQSGVQSHIARFRFTPHEGHRPLHRSPHNGFMGSAR